MKALALLTLVLASLDVVRTSGLNFIHRNSPTAHKYLPETMGGGMALLDYNGDGLLDIFFVNGGRLDEEKRPGDFTRSDPAFWNRLFRQNRDGSFTDVTVAAGLSKTGNVYGMGAAVGDYDNDGYPDLYVTSFGRNTLYHNNGNGTFSDVTEEAGVAASGWSVSAGFFDYDNDGRLDLFVVRYLTYDLEHNILCGTTFHTYCRPDRYNGTTNVLFHNEGGRRFRDVSGPSGIAAKVGKGMGVAFNDYDADGFADIFVSNDLMEQFLFHNQRDGTFQERAMEAGVALSEDGKPFSGMGVAFADYDNDGRPDILVTNLAQEKWALYRNEGGGQFSYATAATGLAALVARSSGWGVGLGDFDNDGYKDIVAARSHVLDNVEKIQPGLHYQETPAIYRNAAGKFETIALAGVEPIAGRGAAIGDLNNDGVLDCVVTALGAHPVVVQGRKNSNHWLTLQLEGTRSNRQALGARVHAGDQWAYVTTAGSYLSASDARVHFGLGSLTSATVEINWPSGVRQLLQNVSADRIVHVKEPE